MTGAVLLLAGGACALRALVSTVASVSRDTPVRSPQHLRKRPPRRLGYACGHALPAAVCLVPRQGLVILR